MLILDLEESTRKKKFNTQESEMHWRLDILKLAWSQYDQRISRIYLDISMEKQWLSNLVVVDFPLNHLKPIHWWMAPWNFHGRERAQKRAWNEASAKRLGRPEPCKSGAVPAEQVPVTWHRMVNNLKLILVYHTWYWLMMVNGSWFIVHIC